MPDDSLQLADFKRALDHAAIVAITDVTGRITYANDQFCTISGYSRGELLGQDHRIINSGYHSKEFIRDLWVTIANGRVWHGELCNRAKDGHLYWVDTTIVPFLDGRGKPYQYIAIRADITARKEAEARLAEQAALARVGQLAAVVAHEVRNPLAGIKGAIQVLMSRRRADDAELPVMRDITERIDALSELINDLIVFARPRPLALGSIELCAVVHDAVAIVRRDPAARQVAIDRGGHARRRPSRPRPDPRGAAQPAPQRRPGDGRPGNNRRHRRRWRRRRDDYRAGQRPWHTLGRAGARVRAVLHDQSTRRRARASDCAPNRRAARRHADPDVSPRRGNHRDVGAPGRRWSDGRATRLRWLATSTSKAYNAALYELQTQR